MQCKVLSSSLPCKSHNNISNINEIKMDVSPSSAAATNIKSRPILRHPLPLSSDDVIQTPDINDDDELYPSHLDRKTTDCVSSNREVLDGVEDIATSPRRRTSVETNETLSLDALAQLCAMHIKQNPKEIVKFVPGSSILLPDSELQLEPTNRALNIPTYIESRNFKDNNDTLCDDLSAITNTSPEELQQIIGKISSTRRMPFRGGSLNNVMEEEAIENSQTDIPTRGLHRSRSHEEVAREMKYTPTRRGVPRSNSGRRKRRIKPLEVASTPVRRLPRKSSAKGASFKGSLKNVLEHEQVEDGNIELLRSERRRSWSGKSYRSNSQNSIRLCSTSSISSCGSAKSSRQFSYGSDSSSAARSNNISTLMDSMISCYSWDGSSQNFMIDHPVLSMPLQFDTMDIPKRSGSSSSSIEDFLSWVNNGGSSCCNVSASISIRAAAINAAAMAKDGYDEHDNDTVAATNKLKQSFKSRKLFKKVRRLSSGIIKPKGRARRSSWHADNEQIPQLAARGPPQRSITAPIDNKKDNQSELFEGQNYNVSPAPAGSRSRRIMNRLVKSLPTRFSFRRSSLEVDDVLDDHNDTKVSRGFRHSTGDIGAAESNEGSTNTA